MVRNVGTISVRSCGAPFLSILSARLDGTMSQRIGWAGRASAKGLRWSRGLSVSTHETKICLDANVVGGSKLFLRVVNAQTQSLFVARETIIRPLLRMQTPHQCLKTDPAHSAKHRPTTKVSAPRYPPQPLERPTISLLSAGAAIVFWPHPRGLCSKLDGPVMPIPLELIAAKRRSRRAKPTFDTEGRHARRGVMTVSAEDYDGIVTLRSAALGFMRTRDVRPPGPNRRPPPFRRRAPRQRCEQKNVYPPTKGPSAPPARNHPLLFLTKPMMSTIARVNDAHPDENST